MAKYLIDRDEMYPVFSIYPARDRTSTSFTPVVEIPEDLVAKVNEAERLFQEAQDELEALYWANREESHDD